MPSYRVSESTTALDLFIFDVVGQDSKETDFIGHIGLADSTGKHEARKISVLDMGPPLHGPDRPRHLRASAIGSAKLTDDEIQKIRTFVNRHANEHQALQLYDVKKVAPQMYCIHPHVSPHYEENGRYVRTRFSCAGFVFEAYRKARITLLDLNGLPKVSEEGIRSAYGAQMRLMEIQGMSSEAFGLEGNGPWPVLLCGYLFHALNRDVNDIRSQPYTPSKANRLFP